MKKGGKKKTVSLGVIILVAAYVLLTGDVSVFDSFTENLEIQQTVQTQNNRNYASDEVDYEFRTEKLLKEHYEKHGEEMGYGSAEEYVEAANDVIDDPDALHKTEKEDGDAIYYLEDSNEFVVVSTDGYLRTYFEPSAGMDYYERQ